MKYDNFAYLFPPRPEKAVPCGLLPYYESRGFVAQIKKNGSCTVIFTNGRDVIFKTRHDNQDHRMWSPTPEILEFFKKSVKGRKWDVYAAELIHSKTPNVKNQLYIFDKMVHQGEQLVGMTFEERQSILQCQWDGALENHFVRITKNVTVARNFTSGFARMYNAIVQQDDVADEGLVLKNPQGILKPCFKATANVTSMVKVRRPQKNYSF